MISLSFSLSLFRLSLFLQLLPNFQNTHVRMNINQGHSWIIFVSSVRTILFVIKPSLETGAEMLLDLASVGVDDCFTRDGNPVTRL